MLSGATSLSPDHKFLAVAVRTGIDIHNLDTKIPGTTIPTQAGLASPVQFIHNGKVLVGGCDLGTVRLWSQQDGRRLQTLIHSGMLAMCMISMRLTRAFSCLMLPETEPVVAVAVS